MDAVNTANALIGLMFAPREPGSFQEVTQYVKWVSYVWLSKSDRLIYYSEYLTNITFLIDSAWCFPQPKCSWPSGGNNVINFLGAEHIAFAACSLVSVQTTCHPSCTLRQTGPELLCTKLMFSYKAPEAMCSWCSWHNGIYVVRLKVNDFDIFLELKSCRTPLIYLRINDELMCMM